MKEDVALPRRIFEGRENIGFSLSHFAGYESPNMYGDEASHIHDFTEIYVNISGETEFIVGDNVYSVGHGDAVISPADTFHHCVLKSSGVHERFFLWLDAGRFPVGSIFMRGGAVVLPSDKRLRLIDDFYALARERDSAILSNAAVSAFFDILATLEAAGGNIAAPSKLPPLLSVITQYINKFYGGDCSERALCERFFVSRSTLCRIFRKNLGVTPSRYVETRRLSEAKRLLEKGESVQNVCFSCGFGNYSHFIALFKRRFGVTPYRYGKAERR